MAFGSLLKSIDVKSAGLHEVTGEELLRLQGVLADMLQEISDECEEYGIPWSLSGGSVIGCVRHKGFIPWDDDIDIFMLREDYNRFREIFPRKLAAAYELKDPGEKGNMMHFPRIYKRGTKSKSIQSDDNTASGVAIDIFPLENTYDNKLLRSFHGVRCNMFLFIDSVLRAERCKDNIIKYGRQNPELMKELKRRLFFARFFHFRSLEEWLRRTDRCFSKVKDESSELVVAPGGLAHYFGELFDRGKMTALMKAPFEGKEFYIMKGYDYYLRKRYGEDYMTPPDESARERHVFMEFDLGSLQ